MKPPLSNRRHCFLTRAHYSKNGFNLSVPIQFENGASPTDSEEENLPRLIVKLSLTGCCKVDSLVKANIRSAFGTLVMTEKGRVEADVDVRIAIIEGCLAGNLRATEYVVLESGARVSGNIHTPSLEVRYGAVFEGSSFFIERGVYSQSCHIETETEEFQAAAVGA